MSQPSDMLGDYTDSERLEWVINRGMFKVQGSDQHGWRVLDMRNGLSFITDVEWTMRDAIDSAMNMEKENKIRVYKNYGQ